MIKLSFLFLSLLCFSGGCAFGTVIHKVDDAEFQRNNQPIRKITSVVLLDGSMEQEEVLKTMSEASDLLKIQAGIEFEKVIIKEMDWNGVTSWTGALRMAKHVCGLKPLGHEQYDLCFLFSKKRFGEDYFRYLFWPIVPTVVFAKIDDTWRRYIFIRYGSVGVVLHETIHAFALETGEMSDHCVMASGLYAAPWCRWMGMSTWEEVQKHKWRDFDEKPYIPSQYKRDCIGERCESEEF